MAELIGGVVIGAVILVAVFVYRAANPPDLPVADVRVALRRAHILVSQ